MKKVETMLKGLRTKKSVLEAVRNFNSKDLTEEGKAIVQYLLDLFNSNMGDMTLTEMREEVLTLMQNNAFKNMNEAEVIFENAIKPKKVTVKKSTKKQEVEDKDYEATEEEIEKVLASIGEEPEEQETKPKKPKKETKKEISKERIFELVGYRYTYPKFPETFTSPILEGKTFHIVEEDDPKKIQEMYEKMLDGTGNDLVVAMYFPKYERDYDVDPHGVVSYDTPIKQVLKKYGGHFPNDLDIQSIVHFDGNTKTLVSVSAFTGIPYATSCRANLFVTNNDLRCRVTQNGLDYQIYEVR